MGKVVAIGECMVELSGGADSVYKLGFAGDTFNTAYYLRARLGQEWSVDYFTALGDDIYSRKMLDHIEQCGIGTGGIRVIPGKRAGLYMIHQAHGDRHFTYWRDTSAARQLADDEEALGEALDGAELVYFSGITLAILAPDARMRLFEAIAARKNSGAVVAFDPNVRPALWNSKEEVCEALMAAASISTIVLPTHADEVPYFGDSDEEATAQRYLESGAEEVAVKNGNAPMLAATASERVRVPARVVETVVDATGAGDSFNGAYIAARLGGAGLKQAAEQGHATASIVIGHHGALVPRDRLELCEPDS